MIDSQWKAYVADEAARAADEVKRDRLMTQLEEAERLLFDEHWTFDDPWPGIIYRRGEEGWRRIDIETWVMMRALMRGLGEAGNLASKPRVTTPVGRSPR